MHTKSQPPAIMTRREQQEATTHCALLDKNAKFAMKIHDIFISLSWFFHGLFHRVDPMKR